MSQFEASPEFQKEFAKLARKYPSLFEDLQKFEAVLRQYPAGVGVNFTTLYSSDAFQIIKSRLACRSLRSRSLRIVYAYHQSALRFLYIEIYFKGSKESEDVSRIRDYIKQLSENPDLKS